MKNEVFGFDAFSPGEIAERVQNVGVAKARLPLVSLVMLGMLAGAFIGLGSLYYVIVISDPGLSNATQRVLGGVVFSLGLLLVVVAGAVVLAGLVLLSGHADQYAGTYLKILETKTSLPLAKAFFSGVMCNVLVCMAVWMSLAGRGVVDKAVAIVLPVELAGLARNLAPVIAGNLVGGSVLVALVYHVIYRWPLRTASTLAPSRKASEG